MSLETRAALLYLGLVGCTQDNSFYKTDDAPSPFDTGDSAIVDTAGIEDTGRAQCPWVDYFLQETPDKVDIVLDVDKSGSMLGNQSNVLLGIEAIMNELELHPEIDWRMALIPTDITTAGTVSEQPLSSGSTIDDALALYNTLTQWDSNEKGLEALEIYVTSNPTAAGWLRNDKEVPFLGIFISDEQDQSYAGLTSTEAIATFESFYTPLRDSVYVASIVHTDETEPCFSDEAGGTPSLGTRYVDVTENYDGIVVDICSDGSYWAAGLQDATNRMAESLQDSIQLQYTPIIETVTVLENGYYVPEKGNWYYDPNMNTVYFLEGAIPPAGTFVEVVYDINLDDQDCPTGAAERAERLLLPLEEKIELSRVERLLQVQE